MTPQDVSRTGTSAATADALRSEGDDQTPGGTRSPWSQLARTAGRLHSDGVTRGERAELRRMRVDDVPPEIYWRLTDELTWPSGPDVFDRYWITVLPLMTRHEHRPKARPGHVLAKAGVKPSRVERWLRRDRETAWHEAGRVLSIAKGARIDWAQLGYLLFSWDDPQVKRRFARDYFRAVHRGAKHGHTDDEGDS